MTTPRLLGREAFTRHNSSQLQRDEVIKIAVRDHTLRERNICPMRTIIQAVIATTIFCRPVISIAEFQPPPGTDCSNPDAKEYDYNCPPLWYDREDKKLNEVYRYLLTTLAAEEAEKLKLSQRAWVAFRDADVALVVQHYGEGGSLGASIAAMRAFQLTRDRVRDLQLRLADPQRW